MKNFSDKFVVKIKTEFYFLFTQNRAVHNVEKDGRATHAMGEI